MAISKLRIFPPIGVARIGNSDSEFFLGPEIPGVVPAPPGGFRDSATKRLKRQGARFRLYAYDESDQLIGEITATDARITWKVHLANTKASAEWFTRKVEPLDPSRPVLRNASVTPRDQLNLDAGIQEVSGANAAFPDLVASKTAGLAKDAVVNKTFFGQPVSVQIGTILTDDVGRLVVLGGRGDAKSPTGRSLNASPSDFANHNEWYDDVADGSVSAEVTFPDGSAPPVFPAWVITAPPKFAPAIHHPVTLYDTLLQAMVDRGLMADPTKAAGYRPLYSRDILPILRSAFNIRWVFAHGRPDLAHHNFHNVLDALPATDDGTILGKLGVPSPVAGEPATGGGDMPKMWSDRYDQAFVNGTLTKIQYANMKLWSAGTFNDDSANPPPPSMTVDPNGLTRAALESCIGAAFYPGIEASWKLRDVYPFMEPFRLDAAKVTPGDVSKQMSLPWQSDFLDCGIENGGGPVQLVWWPAQRPIDVLSNSKYVPWARAFSGAGEVNMVVEWWKLGFVLEQADGTFAEVDRS
jgi:hypothetical protein